MIYQKMSWDGFQLKNQRFEAEKNFFSRGHPASRKFVNRGQAWNGLTAI